MIERGSSYACIHCIEADNVNKISHCNLGIGRVAIPGGTPTHNRRTLSFNRICQVAPVRTLIQCAIPLGPFYAQLRTASRSSEPFFQNSRSLGLLVTNGRTDGQTDRPTERTWNSVGTNRPLALYVRRGLKCRIMWSTEQRHCWWPWVTFKRYSNYTRNSQFTHSQYHNNAALVTYKKVTTKSGAIQQRNRR